MKNYVVELTEEERSSLERMISKGKGATLAQRHARILLKADQGAQGPRWSDARIAEALEVGSRTVARVRQRCVEEGLAAALKPKSRPRFPSKMDGKAEAQLIAQACSKAPKGCARWTLHLLAGRMVELKVVDSLSHETVRKVLKKTSLSLG